MGDFGKDIKKDFFRLIVFGQTGCGKTYWLLNTLWPVLKHGYDEVFVFTKTHNAKVYMNAIEGVHIVTKDYKDTLIQIKQLQEQNITGEDKDGHPIFGSNILLIFDDVLDESLFKDREFMDIFTNMRHLQTSTVLISQITNKAINTRMKSNCSHFCIFRVNDFYQRLDLLRMIENAIANTMANAGRIIPKGEAKSRSEKLYNDNVIRVEYGHIMLNERGDIFI
jgi:hypothetical protein